jgi:hypothetical protein
MQMFAQRTALKRRNFAKFKALFCKICKFSVRQRWAAQNRSQKRYRQNVESRYPPAQMGKCLTVLGGG